MINKRINVEYYNTTTDAVHTIGDLLILDKFIYAGESYYLGLSGVDVFKIGVKTIRKIEIIK